MIVTPMDSPVNSWEPQLVNGAGRRQIPPPGGLATVCHTSPDR
jgi:hypothetical protein